MLTISPMQNLPGFQVGPQHLLEAMTWRWGLSALLSTRDRRALRVYKASMGSRMDTHLLRSTTSGGSTVLGAVTSLRNTKCLL